MKATIKRDFAKLFFRQTDVQASATESTLAVDWSLVEEFSCGDEVEVFRVIEDALLEGEKGYLIYNPKNHATSVVTEDVLDLIQELAVEQQA